MKQKANLDGSRYFDSVHGISWPGLSFWETVSAVSAEHEGWRQVLTVVFFYRTTMKIHAGKHFFSRWSV